MVKDVSIRASAAGSGISGDVKEGVKRTEIYFCRTKGVPQTEYNSIRSGFAKILAEINSPLNIKDFGNFNTGNGDFSSPDWYQEQALTKKERGFGMQVSAYTIDYLLREEPYQKQNPHFDALVVDKDLTTSGDDEENNFIFGYGPYPNNIISVKRFMEWIKNPDLRQASLAIMAAHEFGHNLELVERGENIGQGGYKYGHCNGEKEPCLMEQVNVEGCRTIQEQTKLLFNRKFWLCPDCREEVDARRELLKKYYGPGFI